MTTFSDSTVTGNKQILGDSLTAINALVTDAERQLMKLTKKHKAAIKSYLRAVAASGITVALAIVADIMDVIKFQ